MTLRSRVQFLFQMKSNAALDALEDPVQVMNYGLEAQRELLAKIQAGLIEVATSRQRLARQLESLQQRIPYLETQARRGIEAGREDLARISLERKQLALAEIGRLEQHIAELAGEETRMASASRQISTRIEHYSTRRAVSIARYQAATAQVRVSEGMTGFTGELVDLSAAIARAEERTEQMQARASAFDALLASGAVEIALGGDAVELELQNLASAQSVDAELAQLKSEHTAIS